MKYIKIMPEKSWLTCKFSSSRILRVNYILFMLLCLVQYKKLFYWVTEKLHTMSEQRFSACTVHTAFQVLHHVCVWIQLNTTVPNTKLCPIQVFHLGSSKVPAVVGSLEEPGSGGVNELRKEQRHFLT